MLLLRVSAERFLYIVDSVVFLEYTRCTNINSTLSIYCSFVQLIQVNLIVSQLADCKIKEKGVPMIIIDYKDTRPIYEQIVEKFKILILKGGMQPDEQMPSVRNLAIELSINPNTIQKAYAELERQGFIYTVKGRGNFVSGDSRLVEERQKECLHKILELAEEAMEIGLSKAELMREIEQLKI